MNHLYRNDDGELIAADSIVQASVYHDCTLGGHAEPLPGWVKVLDGEVVKLKIGDLVEEKRADEWAVEFATPMLVGTTYN